MLNQVIIVGRCTRDIELRQSGNTEYAFVTLACDQEFKNKQTGKYETDFIDATIFGTSAKYASQYIHKGDLVQLVGRITPRQVEENGQKRTLLSISGTNISRLAQKGGGSSEGNVSKADKANDDNGDYIGKVDVQLEDDELPF